MESSISENMLRNNRQCLICFRIGRQHRTDHEQVFVLGIMSFYPKTVGRVVLILCIAGHIADVVIDNVVHYAQTIS